MEGVKSKQGCDDLTEDGKQFSASWIVTLANVEHSSIAPSVSQSFNKAIHQKVMPWEGFLMPVHKLKTNSITLHLTLWKQSLSYCKKGDARILYAVVKIILSLTVLLLRQNDYGEVLGLLYFTCVKLLGNKQHQRKGPGYSSKWLLTGIFRRDKYSY